MNYVKVISSSGDKKKIFIGAYYEFVVSSSLRDLTFKAYVYDANDEQKCGEIKKEEPFLVLSATRYRTMVKLEILSGTTTGTLWFWDKSSLSDWIEPCPEYKKLPSPSG